MSFSEKWDDAEGSLPAGELMFDLAVLFQGCSGLFCGDDVAA